MVSLKKRIAIELSIIVTLTPIFLYFAPRGIGLYSGTALLFLSYIVLTAERTRQIWGVPTEPKAVRWRRAVLTMSILTLPIVAAFLVWGYWRGHELSWASLLLALSIYVPWALLQQTIFQFYLLGRLRLLLPVPPVVVATLNGVGYGLVHLPDVPVSLLTIAGGIVWSNSYLRDRAIVPIALSHALLGTTFYNAVVGRDLFHELAGRLTQLF